MTVETFSYDNRIVRDFALATLFWGAAGMGIGLLAALQLTNPAFNLGWPFTTFSHIRPVHTNVLVFAFAGNAIFASVYHSLQRLCKARMFSDLLSRINFWGWQAVFAAAVVTIVAGITTSKEYAEPEWPLDIGIAIVWVAFGINLFGTIIRRREQHMYITIWFYIATFVAITMLHVVNSFELPVSFLKSYSLFAGVQDALVQWWYGHNAVAFFLTTPYLGMMYYYLPKAANRPVFSYRLSIVHFWALIFIYIWAGPHHLLYTALPDWVQSLGTVFSVMLLAPSWGGTLNGLLTLRGAWEKVRDDHVLKFLVVAVIAYGMATFEGPTLAIKSVNALSHFTDWTIAHVHVGVLGWNGFLTFGILYWLIPRLYQTRLYSSKLANFHFWIGFVGILVYVLPLYFAGISQGLMLKDFTPEGFLRYPNFLETVLRIVPMYVIRFIGGSLYFIGFLTLLYNLAKTIRRGNLKEEETVQAPLMSLLPGDKGKGLYRHRWLERRPLQFLLLTTVAVLIGSVIEIVPTLVIKSNVPSIPAVEPFTPLEVEGRDVYIAEGCTSCHTQTVRPFRSETERYGEYSKAGEYVYDHPFLWGSKRTGPDLHRVGGKYPDAWHYAHMIDPASMSPGSIMPPYHWLAGDEVDLQMLPAKIRGLRTLGVNYAEKSDQSAVGLYTQQAHEITARLGEAGYEIENTSKLVALIAYLQRLGMDIRAGQDRPLGE